MIKLNDYFAKLAILFFGLIFWKKFMSYIAFDLLLLAWVLDGGLRKIGEVLKEPFVLAILVLCAVFAVGLLWTDNILYGYEILKRYLMFLVFIPYFHLLNKERLPWAIAGVLTGCLFVIVICTYYVVVLDTQYFVRLKMHYLTFSLLVGAGILSSVYMANMANNKQVRILMWIIVLALMWLQFNLNGRGPLIATVLTELLLIFLIYRERAKQFMTVTAFLLVAVGIFAASSNIIEERINNTKKDIELIKLGAYDTSIGYRLAGLDVGIHGISERPFFGHGTGMSINYFSSIIPTYKDGRYNSLAGFITSSRGYHYHNEWIDLGLNAGALGMLAFAFVILFLVLIISAIAICWQKEYSCRKLVSNNS
jgi:O-antigen ligase